jgi:TolB protein
MAACSPGQTGAIQTPDLPTQTPVPKTIATQTIVPTATSPVPSPDAMSGLIAFYSDRDGNPEINIMKPNGSGVRRLTNDPGFDDSPAISPDGSQVAFLTARHDPKPRFPNLKYEIYVIDSDGSNLHRLTTTDAAEDHPSWSPEGQKIIFDADYDGDGFYEIYTIDSDGSNLTRLTSNAANDQFADWSPDETQIAFSSYRNGNWDIFIMNPDGSNQRQLTDSSAWELFPAWSPDGTQIAFNGLQPGSQNTDVYIMNSDGSHIRQLSDSPRFDENPTWSPDGSQIAFQTQRDGKFKLYTMNPDGSNQHPLVDNSHDDLWPSWGLAPAQKPVAHISFEKSVQEFTSPETFQAGLGDLDNDGDLDAMFANLKANHSQVWLNDGSGYFFDTDQQLTQYGHGVVLADFDEDGDLDAFINCHQFFASSKIYLNDGTGNFQDNGQDLGDAAISGVEVHVLDLNGDNHIDVHVVYYDPSGMPDKVYLNDGKANFSDSSLALGEEPIAWGDLDGDGDVDYFGKNQKIGYVVQLNDGSSKFSLGWQLDDEQSTIGSVALADFDGDGDLDALVTNGSRMTSAYPSRLFLNDGHAQFIDSGQRLNETSGAEISTGDLDLDGDLDVFIANMDLPNEVWLNEDGQLIDSGLRLGEKSDMSGKPSLGDLDGDGDLDVVVGRFRGGAEIWMNNTVLPGD